MNPKPATVDEYISRQPESVQPILQEVLEAVRKAAPGTEEVISYAIPTLKWNKVAVVHFAAFKSHIGFYATPTGHKEFEEELAKYKQGKGSVQFPLDKPMPLQLISRIVKFRMNEVKKAKKMGKS